MKTAAVWAALFQVAPSSEVFSPDAKTLELYEPGEYIYERGGERLAIKYRLHTPPAIQPGKLYPLVLWLHGEGEQGADNKEHLRWLDLVAATSPHADYFALAFQAPEGEPWYRLSEQIREDDLLTIADALVAQIVAERAVDPDRVSLTGVSSGGSACWEMAMRYPERFSAVAPLASTGGDRSRLESIVDVPIWAFHSATDSLRPDQVASTVQLLSQMGGNCYLTLVDNRVLDLKLMHTPQVLIDHDCWTGALEHYRLMEWLLAQRRGAWALPSGMLPWQWWNYALAAGAPLAVGLTMRSWKRAYDHAVEIRLKANRAMDASPTN